MNQPEPFWKDKSSTKLFQCNQYENVGASEREKTMKTYSWRDMKSIKMKRMEQFNKIDDTDYSKISVIDQEQRREL